jgi:methylmalonyl-CoA mutase
MYVMTADYGAASQLEKIDMLDFADFVVLNKFEKRGAEDALRDVRKQVARNRKLFKTPPERCRSSRPIASQFTRRRRQCAVRRDVREAARTLGRLRPWQPEGLAPVGVPKRQAIIPRTALCATSRRSPRRPRRAPRRYRGGGKPPAVRRACTARSAALGDAALPGRSTDTARPISRRRTHRSVAAAGPTTPRSTRSVPRASRCSRHGRSAARPRSAEEYSYRVRDRRSVRAELQRVAFAPCSLPKIADAAARRLGRAARLPADRKPARAPTRTRAASTRTARGRGPHAHVRGRGHAERTNRRFHYLARGHQATRLSTAFDSTTLYGEDPGRAARTSTGASATRASRSHRSTT